MRLRNLKYHVVNRQLFHVRVWLICLYHSSWRHTRYSVLCLAVVVIVLAAGVVIIVVGVIIVIVSTSRGRELLYSGGSGRWRGGRYCVFGAAFPRTFRHPAVSNGWNRENDIYFSYSNSNFAIKSFILKNTDLKILSSSVLKDNDFKKRSVDSDGLVAVLKCERFVES